MDRETWRLTVDGSWSRMNPRGGVVGRAGWTARLRVLDDFFAIQGETRHRAALSHVAGRHEGQTCVVLLLSAAHAGSVATSTRVGGATVRTRQHELISRPKMASEDRLRAAARAVRPIGPTSPPREFMRLQVSSTVSHHVNRLTARQLHALPPLSALARAITGLTQAYYGTVL